MSRARRFETLARGALVAAWLGAGAAGSAWAQSARVDVAPASDSPAQVVPGEVARETLDESTPIVRQVNTILRLDRLRGRTVDDVARELAAVGPAVIQPAFEILAGTLPGPIAEGSPMPPRGTPEPSDVILAAFARLGSRDVARHVLARLDAETPLVVRLVALRVLGDAVGEGGLDAWTRVAGDIDPAVSRQAFVLRACESSLTSVLSRDARSMQALGSRGGSRLQTLPDHLRKIAWNAIASSRRASGIGALTTELAHADDASERRMLLGCLSRLVQSTTGDMTDDELAWIRPLCADDDLELRREALLTLGRVHAAREHAVLVENLQHPDPRVRGAARWSLERLSGAEWGDDPEAWTRWFDAQWAWYAEQVDRLHRAIEIRVPEKSIEAARAWSERRLFRHHAAREIVDLCNASDANLVRQGCVVLREIGSPAAIPGLVESLSSDDPAVRDAVRGTLRFLTGLDLPPDAKPWRAALLGR